MDACNRCGGTGKLSGFACPGFKPVTHPCMDCGGTGQVDDLRQVWRADGLELRGFRQKRDMSLSEAAAFVGVNVVELSKAEHGQVDPQPLMAAWSEAIIRRVRNRTMTP